MTWAWHQHEVDQVLHLERQLKFEVIRTQFTKWNLQKSTEHKIEFESKNYKGPDAFR